MENSVDIVKLGIVLVIVAAAIVIGIIIFSQGKNLANQGSVSMQDNITSVGSSVYEDYNDAVVTGTQLKSALSNFQGKSMAILVNTNALTKGVKTYSAHENSYVFEVSGVNYINYNALLGGDSSGGLPSTKVTGGNKISSGTSFMDADGKSGAKLVDGSLTISNPFAIDATTGKICYDNTVGGMSRSGNCEYINQNAKFQANLIKDASGTIIGILFTQQAS